MKYSLLILCVLFLFSCDRETPNTDKEAEKTDKTNQSEPMVGGGCRYTSIQGTAQITAVSPAPKDANNCPDAVQIIVNFVPKKPTKLKYENFKNEGQAILLYDGKNPSKTWAKRQDLIAGKKLICVRKEIAEGTCTPVIFEFPELDMEPEKYCE